MNPKSDQKLPAQINTTESKNPIVVAPNFEANNKNAQNKTQPNVWVLLFMFALFLNVMVGLNIHTISYAIVFVGPPVQLFTLIAFVGLIKSSIDKRRSVNVPMPPTQSKSRTIGMWILLIFVASTITGLLLQGILLLFFLK